MNYLFNILSLTSELYVQKFNQFLHWFTLKGHVSRLLLVDFCLFGFVAITIDWP